MSAGLVPSEGFEGRAVPGISLWIGDGYLLDVFTLSFLCVLTSLVSLPISPNLSSHKNTSQSSLGPTLMTLL